MTSRGSKYIYMFLFSDIIVLALKKSKSTKYKVLDVITLLTIRILNIPDTEGTSAAFMHSRVAALSRRSLAHSPPPLYRAQERLQNHWKQGLR